MIDNGLAPADELFEIRQQMKVLRIRAEKIKEGMIDGSLTLDGKSAVAVLKHGYRKKFERKLAEEELGDLSRFYIKSKTVRLTLQKLD